MDPNLTQNTTNLSIIDIQAETDTKITSKTHTDNFFLDFTWEAVTKKTITENHLLRTNMSLFTIISLEERQQLGLWY